jgi:hypothetical protein
VSSCDSSNLRLTPTVAETLGIIIAGNLKKAHALIESGRARGKLVLEGFDSGGSIAPVEALDSSIQKMENLHGRKT